MKRLRYPRYKPSGVAWLGALPSHWRVDRLKWTAAGCINGIWGDEADGGEDDIVCVRVADFDRVGLRVNLEQSTVRCVTQSERKSRVLARGDLLLEKSGGGSTQPVGAVVQFDQWVDAVSSNFIARIPAAEGMDSRYLTYLHAHLYATGVNKRSIKQTTGIQNLDSQAYFDEQVCFPPLDEQRAIAAFLDRETARIDALIETKRRLIAVLEERRDAMIGSVVTRGLRASKRGPSNSKWSLLPLKRRLEWITSGSRGWAQHYSDDGSLFLRIGNLTRDSIDVDLSDTQFVRPPDNSEGERTLVEAGDLLISITAYLGSVAVAPACLGKAYVSQHVALARPHRDVVHPRWLAYCLFSRFGRNQLEIAGYGGTKVQLGLDDVANVLVPLPPRDEQDRLVRFLDSRTAQVAIAIRQVTRAVDVLLEYRQAIVADAVCGMLDVRTAA